MIILIAGATHTGKTAYAQKLMEEKGYPYLSIDHLKMGLIRSGQTPLTPEDDEALRDYLWPIVREMIKTAIENRQNLIVEGCYIPFDWQKDFPPAYLEQIQYVCLVMSRDYVQRHYADILRHANVIEQRLENACPDPEKLIAEHADHRAQCEAYGLPYILIDGAYSL